MTHPLGKARDYQDLRTKEMKVRTNRQFWSAPRFDWVGNQSYIVLTST